ncbi:hypothetical protein [Salinispora pacifica]|uniref:hypothetical protein n=1 Tax=Salinispora pacifica TaxID=351187 RepID=UPI00037AE5D0|nr:hypothetical protein [Salinispora pacifica]
MLKTSFFRALLIPTAILALTACGGEDDSEPAASESNSPSAASSSAPAAAAAKSDEEVCEAVAANLKSVQENMMQAFTPADGQTDEALTEALTEVFSELATGMTEIAATGSADSEVTVAVQALSAEAEKMVADPNLIEGADNPAYESAAEAVTEACQKVGVEIE